MKSPPEIKLYSRKAISLIVPVSLADRIIRTIIVVTLIDFPRRSPKSPPGFFGYLLIGLAVILYSFIQLSRWLFKRSSCLRVWASFTPPYTQQQNKGVSLMVYHHGVRPGFYIARYRAYEQLLFLHVLADDSLHCCKHVYLS